MRDPKKGTAESGAGVGKKTGIQLALALFMAAGCNNLLLTNPEPDPAADPRFAAPAVKPLNRESHVAYFPIGAGTPHADQTCIGCHVAPDTFKEVSCLSCHAHSPDVAARRHLHITGFRYDSAACRSCHPSGGEAPISSHDHSAKFFPIVTGPHATVPCATCHTDPRTSKTFVCRGCHLQPDTDTQHGDILGYLWAESACYGCHHAD